MNKIIILLLMLINFNLLAGEYYVDDKKGDDLNSGTSPDSAWRTIAKVNSSSFTAGDVINLRRGGIWRQQLILFSSGKITNPIVVSAYGEGEKPILSGADILSGFESYSKYTWRISSATAPQQIFITGIRGEKKNDLASVNKDYNWFYDSAEKYLYLYLEDNPSSYLVERTSRSNAINIASGNIIVEDIKVEKTTRSGIKISTVSENVILDNISLLQWSAIHTGENAGIDAAGSNIEIKNCEFGKSTGDDIADQNWAGFIGISITGKNVDVHNNRIYHNSTENENGWGLFSVGIRVQDFKGNVRIHQNYIYHTGSHGVLIGGYSSKEDSIFIFDNVIEYPGQAGISAYKTRATDSFGATGFVYKNKIGFANRLGGDVGSNGAQSCGIHMNDGVIANTEPDKPFIKWYIYENVVHNSQSQADSTSEDSGGIIADYDANNVEIFRNLIFNNWGKGISLWNANNCKVYYNVVYGNDAGIIITAANGTLETASNNEIYNNTFYKNFNGFEKGSNYNTEIYFGKNGHNNIIQNNIFYASDVGYAYRFDTTNTSGIIVDHNLIFKDTDGFVCYDNKNRGQTFESWLANHPEWDNKSLNQNPSIQISTKDLDIGKDSPAIDNGLNIGQEYDFKKNRIVGEPDIGAIEFVAINGIGREVTPVNFTLYQNFPNPFNPTTTIRFSIETNGIISTPASLKVYDILGNLVATLIDKNLAGGDYEIMLNSSEENLLSSGVYLYTLKAGDLFQTKKLILLK